MSRTSSFSGRDSRLSLPISRTNSITSLEPDLIGKVSFDETPVISRNASVDSEASLTRFRTPSVPDSGGPSRNPLSRSSSGNSLAGADAEVAEQLAAVVKELSPPSVVRH